MTHQKVSDIYLMKVNLMKKKPRDKKSDIITIGCGANGELGRGFDILFKSEKFVLTGHDSFEHLIQAEMSRNHTLCLAKDGDLTEVFSFGQPINGSMSRTPFHCSVQYLPIPVRIPGMSVRKVAVGTTFSSFLTTEGELFVSGCFVGDDGVVVTLDVLPKRQVLLTLLSTRLKFHSIFAQNVYVPIECRSASNPKMTDKYKKC